MTRWCVLGAGRELCPVGRWRISRSCPASWRRLLPCMPPTDRLAELAGVAQVTSMKQVGAMVGDQELSVRPWRPTAVIEPEPALCERSADPASLTDLGGGAQFVERGLQERHRRTPGLVEDHLLHRAEGGFQGQRGARQADQEVPPGGMGSPSAVVGF